ncbi:MAG: RecX family transcriptional regulator [Anaerolineaceae bacterium]|nr:RecX family transcriptional regulator [Anaerolineaceae bacterium]
MATITALQVDKRKRDRVNVFLDGARAFSLASTLAAGLGAGQPLDDAAIARLQQEDEVARAVDQAVRFLGYRPRSVAEAGRNLRRKGFTDGAISAALERMTQQGWLDDLAFARFWVEERLRFRPMGRRALAYELRQKGVEAEIIDTALADVDSLDAARRAARKSLRRRRGETQEKLRRKLWDSLQRRGFEADLCRQVVEEILTENGESEAAVPLSTGKEYPTWRP